MTDAPHTVVPMTPFLREAEALGLSEDDVAAIIVAIAEDPTQGAVMAGTGGVRKVRFAAKGKGKSGGVRTVHYYGGDEMPVFLIAIYGKSDKANLTKAERNTVKALTETLEQEFLK